MPRLYRVILCINRPVAEDYPAADEQNDMYVPVKYQISKVKSPKQITPFLFKYCVICKITGQK